MRIQERISPQSISIKKSKSGFNGFPFYCSMVKSEKSNCKTLLVNSGLPFAYYASACKTAVHILRTVFQILFRISQMNGKKEIQKQISQRWNPFSNFTFICKPEIQILKSKSTFPNLIVTHLFFLCQYHVLTFIMHLGNQYHHYNNCGAEFA